MQLYGSDTSPYARRIRMFAATHNVNLPYTCLDIFSSSDREIMVKHNPARKIPFLVDGNEAIADSGLIMRYLSEKHALPHMSWWQQNQLAQIDACNDSLIELLLSQRSGFDTQQDKLFFNLQYERITALLNHLNEQCVKTEFLNSSYLQISLYCLLDWILFRDLYDLSDYAALQAFYKSTQSLAGVVETDPRNS